ncbi:MAG: hypothetical protein RSA95_07185 [Citrobacter sp.]|uniref:hypothetical protein n=1 Tax=Citrobacter sp. TaxID=1896336 RepID=UPI002FC90BE7
MPSILLVALSKAKKLLALFWQFFTGIVVAVVAFSTNFYDLKQPDISVEITALASTNSVPLDLASIPELSELKNTINLFGMEKGITPEEIERQLNIITTNNSDDEKNIENLAKKFDDIIKNNENAQEQLAELSYLAAERAPFFGLYKSTDSKPELPEEKISRLTSQIKDNLSARRVQQTELARAIKSAKAVWETYKSSTLQNKTRLVVTCAIGNRGAGATSLKPQALFRANLGSGNYLDFPMKLSGYNDLSTIDNASLQPEVFKVLRFESDELQSMVPVDRDRFKTFLGNALPATLFISDVRGKTYSSNTVPFSPGVYEQKIFDSLKQFASKLTPETER